MKDSDIEKVDASNPDDVLAAITSFNDPSIITNIFRDLGWNYSTEIKETLALARQNANLSIKFKAIKYLRDLIREAAETSGYTARVSQTIPDAHGGTTTFSAKRIANVLNPAKQIESSIKENQNGKKETQTDPDRGCDREQSQTQESGDSSEPIRDSRRAFPIGDVESGGTEPQDGGETSRPVPRGKNSSKDNKRCIDRDDSNPCIQTRPPASRGNLFPGISSAED